MIGHRGCAGQHQLDQAEPGTDIYRLGIQFGPDRIQGLQPIEQRLALCSGEAAGQGLKQVMVAVHQPGNDNATADIDMSLGLSFQLSANIVASADGLDDIVSNQYRPVFDFATRIVHGHQHPGLIETDYTLTVDGGCGFGGALLAACVTPAGELVDQVEA